MNGRIRANAGCTSVYLISINPACNILKRPSKKKHPCFTLWIIRTKNENSLERGKAPRMKIFKNILHPVVLGRESEDVVPFIQIMAKQFDSQIHLLSVLWKSDQVVPKA
jgi:hypothetical protein